MKTINELKDYFQLIATGAVNDTAIANISGTIYFGSIDETGFYSGVDIVGSLVNFYFEPPQNYISTSETYREVLQKVTIVKADNNDMGWTTKAMAYDNFTLLFNDMKGKINSESFLLLEETYFKLEMKRVVSARTGGGNYFVANAEFKLKLY